jgi:hypothetical protein
VAVAGVYAVATPQTPAPAPGAAYTVARELKIKPIFEGGKLSAIRLSARAVTVSVVRSFIVYSSKRETPKPLSLERQAEVELIFRNHRRNCCRNCGRNCWIDEDKAKGWWYGATLLN